MRDLRELSESGLLWLINRAVFHPRGLALALERDSEGAVTGWALHGDGSEEWSFAPEHDRRGFLAAQRTLAEAVKDGGLQ
jgi:hypothetical protein